MLLFASAVGGAWSWFHVGVRAPETVLLLQARPIVPGYQFNPESVGTNAVEILSTTNLVNGTFTGPAGQRVMVFKADWLARDSKQLDVVGHTPDICWVGAGWVSYDAGQPPLVEVELEGGRMTFECRAFRGPGGVQTELVMWSTLVNGQVMEEGARFRNFTREDEVPKERMATAARRRGANLLVRSIRDRIPATGDKQFVRFSVPLRGEWQPALEQLKTFAVAWLSVADLRKTAAL